MSEKESLESMYSNYLELKMHHSRKSLKDTSSLKKIRKKIARIKTAVKSKKAEVKND
ncbi:MAG: 50S ribosomal protein L29 [Alphaproteobacteria bacterium]|nr:MAG: 50S ribosomal protein L29 [Alphaproteobacteria bacterium]